MSESLARRGIRVVIGIQTQPSSGGALIASELILPNRYQLDQPINPNALNDSSSSAIRSGIVFSHYLDHTLQARKHILLEPGFNEQRLDAELANFWSGIEALQGVLPVGHWHAVEPGASVDAPLDEKAIVDQALGGDFGFLIRKWGWYGNGLLQKC